MDATLFGLPVFTVIFIAGVPLLITAALTVWGLLYTPGTDDSAE